MNSYLMTWCSEDEHIVVVAASEDEAYTKLQAYVDAEIKQNAGMYEEDSEVMPVRDLYCAEIVRFVK